MRRIGTGLLLASLLALPAAAAPDGSVVDLAVLEAPDTIVVDHKFPLVVQLQNKANEAKSVQLYTFLYRHEEGKTCGGTGDPRFLGPADRSARPALTIPAGATVVFPAEGGLPWWHEVNASQVNAAGPHQLCVFAYAGDFTGGVSAYDLVPRPVALRLENRLPAVDFTWSPPVGNVTTEFRFVAEVGADPDGDPLEFHWQFGHLTAKGPAVAEGSEVTHAFWHASALPRTYLVNLTVRDGFGSVTARHSVVVEPEGVPAPQRWVDDMQVPWWRSIPAPAAAPFLLAIIAAALARRAGSR